MRSRPRALFNVTLTTAKTNTPAQAAYESLGWLRDKVVYAYSQVVQARPLP